ncbi:YveK family protein [Halobacillus salinus]|uniref:Capsular biosynthesis protein n=1 Tax=Halobacillus salinus TaxID=192814 RepID=A0A4Z0GWY9_9BACI|nr:Wzz/FepE/Etk N-terminal domain-containing protein [Halobacillus salinus]TGB01719.1 capsular biosynthesis protein [Halobacillus salinus]
MEETISLQEVFEVLKKRVVMIISLALGAALISGLVTFFVLTPMYQSSTQFIVNQSSNQQQSAAYDINDIRTNVELINTYNVIIKSPAILDRVIEELELNTSTAELSDQISVVNSGQSQVVDVTVIDADPSKAVQIANTTVEIFQDEISTLMNADNVRILSPAVLTADPSPVSPNLVLNISVAILVGLMVGIALALLIDYFDNTVKSEQDIENATGLPVMGVVSTYSKEEVELAYMNSKGARRNDIRRESLGS